MSDMKNTFAYSKENIIIIIYIYINKIITPEFIAEFHNLHCVIFISSDLYEFILIFI